MESGRHEDCEELHANSSTSTEGKDSEAESSDSIDPNMEFQADFEARSIQSDDFLGIRRLLQQLFLKASVDLSGLTELAIATSSLHGSTVKVTDDGEADDNDCDSRDIGEGDDVCGVTTFISLTHNQNHSCVQQIKEHLLSQCKLHSSTNFQQFSDLLSDPIRPIGLLISERLLNLPMQIGALLLRSLQSELSETVPPESSCQLVAVIARSHLLLTAGVGKKRKSKDNPQREQQIFDYIENEFMLKDCLVSFSYPVGTESDRVFGGDWSLDDVAMEPFRTVMIIPYSSFEHVIDSLEKYLQEKN